MAGATSVAAVPQQKAKDVRVPFVRRCRLEYDDGRGGTAFLVNLNDSGAYVARDDLRPAGAAEALPALGTLLRCIFRLPGRDRDVVVSAAVTWVNPHQQHPVHGLPPGFGLGFRTMPDEDRRAIVAMVADYLARHPAVGRL
jgi:hypothetical protein